MFVCLFYYTTLTLTYSSIPRGPKNRGPKRRIPKRNRGPSKKRNRRPSAPIRPPVNSLIVAPISPGAGCAVPALKALDADGLATSGRPHIVFARTSFSTVGGDVTSGATDPILTRFRSRVVALTGSCYNTTALICKHSSKGQVLRLTRATLTELYAYTCTCGAANLAGCGRRIVGSLRAIYGSDGFPS